MPTEQTPLPQRIAEIAVHLDLTTHRMRDVAPDDLGPPVGITDGDVFLASVEGAVVRVHPLEAEDHALGRDRDVALFEEAVEVFCDTR
jgi:hypothetical protein